MADLGTLRVRITASAAELQSTLTSTKSQLSSWGRNTDQVLRKNRESLSTLGIAFGAIGGALTGLSAVAIATFTSFEREMKNVQSVANATEADFRALSDEAKRLGETTAFSAREAGAGMYYLASAGYDVNQIFAAQEDILTAAIATQSNLAESTKIIVGTMNSFGIAAENADRVTNVFAATISTSQATMQRLGTAMPYVGATFDNLGYSVETASGALGILFNRGLEASMAGTRLRGSMNALLKPSEEATKALMKLGLTIEDVNPATHSLVEIVREFEQAGLPAAEAVRIFGQRSEGMTILAKEGADALEDMIEKVTGTNRAAEMAKTQMDSLSGSFKLLKSAIEGAAINFGEALAPAMRSVTEQATGLINKFNQMPTGVQQVAAELTALTGGIALLAGGFLLLLSRLPQIIDGFSAMKKITKGFPVGLGNAVAAVGALTASLWALHRITTALSKPIDNVAIALNVNREYMSQVASMAKTVEERLEALNKRGMRLEVTLADLGIDYQKFNEVMGTNVDSSTDAAHILSVLKNRLGETHEAVEKIIPEWQKLSQEYRDWVDISGAGYKATTEERVKYITGLLEGIDTESKAWRGLTNMRAALLAELEEGEKKLAEEQKKRQKVIDDAAKKETAIHQQQVEAAATRIMSSERETEAKLKHVEDLMDRLDDQSVEYEVLAELQQKLTADVLAAERKAAKDQDKLRADAIKKEKADAKDREKLKQKAIEDIEAEGEAYKKWYNDFVKRNEDLAKKDEERINKRVATHTKGLDKEKEVTGKWWDDIVAITKSESEKQAEALQNTLNQMDENQDEYRDMQVSAEKAFYLARIEDLGSFLSLWNNSTLDFVGKQLKNVDQYVKAWELGTAQIQAGFDMIKSEQKLTGASLLQLGAGFTGLASIGISAMGAIIDYQKQKHEETKQLWLKENEELRKNAAEWDFWKEGVSDSIIAVTEKLDEVTKSFRAFRTSLIPTDPEAPTAERAGLGRGQEEFDEVIRQITDHYDKQIQLLERFNEDTTRLEQERIVAIIEGIEKQGVDMLNISKEDHTRLLGQLQTYGVDWVDIENWRIAEVAKLTKEGNEALIEEAEATAVVVAKTVMDGIKEEVYAVRDKYAGLLRIAEQYGLDIDQIRAEQTADLMSALQGQGQDYLTATEQQQTQILKVLTAAGVDRLEVEKWAAKELLELQELYYDKQIDRFDFQAKALAETYKQQQEMFAQHGIETRLLNEEHNQNILALLEKHGYDLLRITDEQYEALGALVLEYGITAVELEEARLLAVKQLQDKYNAQEVDRLDYQASVLAEGYKKQQEVFAQYGTDTALLKEEHNRAILALVEKHEGDLLTLTETQYSALEALLIQYGISAVELEDARLQAISDLNEKYNGNEADRLDYQTKLLAKTHKEQYEVFAKYGIDTVLLKEEHNRAILALVEKHVGDVLSLSRREYRELESQLRKWGIAAVDLEDARLQAISDLNKKYASAALPLAKALAAIKKNYGEQIALLETFGVDTKHLVEQQNADILKMLTDKGIDMQVLDQTNYQKLKELLQAHGIDVLDLERITANERNAIQRTAWEERRAAIKDQQEVMIAASLAAQRQLAGIREEAAALSKAFDPVIYAFGVVEGVISGLGEKLMELWDITEEGVKKELTSLHESLTGYEDSYKAKLDILNTFGIDATKLSEEHNSGLLAILEQHNIDILALDETQYAALLQLLQQYGIDSETLETARLQAIAALQEQYGIEEIAAEQAQAVARKAIIDATVGKEVVALESGYKERLKKLEKYGIDAEKLNVEHTTNILALLEKHNIDLLALKDDEYRKLLVALEKYGIDATELEEARLLAIKELRERYAKEVVDPAAALKEQLKRISDNYDAQIALLEQFGIDTEGVLAEQNAAILEMLTQQGINVETLGTEHYEKLKTLLAEYGIDILALHQIRVDEERSLAAAAWAEERAAMEARFAERRAMEQQQAADLLAIRIQTLADEAAIRQAARDKQAADMEAYYQRNLQRQQQAQADRLAAQEAREAAVIDTQYQAELRAQQHRDRIYNLEARDNARRLDAEVKLVNERRSLLATEYEFTEEAITAANKLYTEQAMVRVEANRIYVEESRKQIEEEIKLMEVASGSTNEISIDVIKTQKENAEAIKSPLEVLNKLLFELGKNIRDLSLVIGWVNKSLARLEELAISIEETLVKLNSEVLDLNRGFRALNRTLKSHNEKLQETLDLINELIDRARILSDELAGHSLTTSFEAVAASTDVAANSMKKLDNLFVGAQKDAEALAGAMDGVQGGGNIFGSWEPVMRQAAMQAPVTPIAQVAAAAMQQAPQAQPAQLIVNFSGPVYGSEAERDALAEDIAKRMKRLDLEVRL